MSTLRLAQVFRTFRNLICPSRLKRETHSQVARHDHPKEASVDRNDQEAWMKQKDQQTEEPEETANRGRYEMDKVHGKEGLRRIARCMERHIACWSTLPSCRNRTRRH